MIDDHMADVLWPGEDPIGRRLRRGGMDADPNAPWLTVVGIVGRIKQYTLDETDSRVPMYHPHTQVPSRAMNVTLRSAAEPAGLTSAATAIIRAIDPDLPIYNVRPMEGRVEESLARRRFSMLLPTLFAILALGLATAGVYGVTFVTIAAVLSSAALAASYLPARRAARIDPMTSLRSE